MNDSKNWRILMVDDDEDDYLIIRDMLQGTLTRQIQVDWVARYDQFMDLACLDLYDLFLVDYKLNSYTGLELIQQLHEKCPTAKAILITSWPDRRIQKLAQQYGPVELLHKFNLSSEILMDAIQKVLGEGT